MGMAGRKFNYRDEILSTVHEILKRKGTQVFEVGEVVEFMLSKNSTLNASTIRTHVTSRCCVNASPNHAVTYNDYERVGRGLYRLYELEGEKERKWYFVDVNTRNNYLLALDVDLQEESDKARVEFFDTNRGRGFKGKVLIQEEGGFIFQTEKGDIMTFRIATVDEFDRNWRRMIEGGVPSFGSDKELHKWYYDQFL